MIKIAAISDLHGIIPKGIYPEIELLIIAGDLPKTDVVKDQEEWFLTEFIKIRDSFPDLQNIYIIPGNHDFWIERNYNIPTRISSILGRDVIILVDKLEEFTSFSTGEKIKIYGNPRTSLCGYAFPHLYNEEDILNIPDDLDILVTHEAPRLYELECIKKVRYGKYDLPGNITLSKRVSEIKVKYHIFGHIHYPCSIIKDGVKYINVSQKVIDVNFQNINIINYGEEIL